MYGVHDGAAARAYKIQSQLPREQRPPQTPGPPAWSAARREWRLLWRRIGRFGAPAGPASTFYLEGTDLPKDENDASAPPGGLDLASTTRFELYHRFETPASAALGT